MVTPKTQRCAFLLLTLLALQQGCRTSPVVPSPERASQIEEAENSSKGTKETKPQSTDVKPESSKNPQTSIAAIPIERLPESVVGAPERELASPKISYDTVLLGRTSNASIYAGWDYWKNRQSQIVGFEFSNRGGNRILPERYDIGKNLLFTRDFQFRFDDRARQDILLFISDWAPSRDKQFRLSDLMNTVMHFFPRNYLPAIRASRASYVVTLPTGEEVEFDAKTREVLGGVFSDPSVDFNPDRTVRKFPGINYIGKGVVVRANARGKDPRIRNVATITTGTPPPDCEKGTACNQCQVPSQDLWLQNGPIRFKFSTDQEFDRYLMSHCGFGIPKESQDRVALPRQ